MSFKAHSGWVASVDFFKHNMQGFTEAGEVAEAARREVIGAPTVSLLIRRR